ncbi:MAG: hypothetical protein RUMPE_00953 [Eubacteriales bacterium SKADARSKE-1]|nr:hypothetical protein [Eubacteriales bacterium SKADARSKE-1]
MTKYQVDNLYKKGYLKTRKACNGKSSTNLLYYEDVLNFLKQHPDKWDGTKISEYFCFDVDSPKIAEKIKHDKKFGFRMVGTPFTDSEQIVMVNLFKKGCTRKAIAKEMGRTFGAIASRLIDTDIWGTGKYLGKGFSAQKHKKIKTKGDTLILNLQEKTLKKGATLKEMKTVK